MAHATEELARRESITEDDYSSLHGLSMFNFYQSSPTSSTPGLPGYWSIARDHALKSTLKQESMWASAVSKAISKQTSLGFTVDDAKDRQIRARKAQALFLRADYVRGRPIGGWVPFLTRHLLDVLLTDNGGFIEIIRASPAAGSRVLGLAYLDSHRCERTGNAEFPVVFRQLDGKRHYLREHQVVCFADMGGAFTESTFGQMGVGFCAASRAYDSIYLMAAIRQYLREKITGARATSLWFVGPMAPHTLKSAIATANEEMVSQGRQLYKGANVIPVIDQPPGVAEVRLSEIPDGFNADEERRNAYMVYANALGVPVQDIQPLSGQGLGTGTQSVVLDEASKGEGLAAWRKWWEQTFNELVLSTSTTFAFAANDTRDKKALAEVQEMRATTRAGMIESGQISAVEARQMAADSGDIPKEFLVEDQTPGGTLDDTDKVVASSESQINEPAQPEAEAPPIAATTLEKEAEDPQSGDLSFSAFEIWMAGTKP